MLPRQLLRFFHICRDYDIHFPTTTYLAATYRTRTSEILSFACAVQSSSCIKVVYYLNPRIMPHQVVSRPPRVRSTADVTAGQEPVCCSSNAANQVSSTHQLNKSYVWKSLSGREVVIFCIFPSVADPDPHGSSFVIYFALPGLDPHWETVFGSSSNKLTKRFF